MKINKLTVYLVGALLLMGLLSKALWTRNRDKGKVIDSLNTSLKEATGHIAHQDFINKGLQAQIVIANNQMNVVERHITVTDTLTKDNIITRRIYIPRESKVVVSVDTLGKIHFRVRKWGVCFRPLIDIGITKSLVVGLKTRLIYYQRWGVQCGISYSLSGRDWGFPLEIGYRLDRIKLFSNCQVSGGYDLNRKVGTLSFGIFL